ncbi:hypothetical protein B0H67DRAFT_595789 [Lasiosphaeris hirsuta]|uniref:Uncharacterized protein n=1 Tax=Lasiosphaeris hirsuta TaxID=260670 RepID=A0AA39ZPI0_9PEZI|nr:hypothetical protein B0H67DRAFT_595789 [Lasiosphaeris hirsuta]
MVAPDISSWIGVDRHRTLERAKASKQFDSKLKILVFEADGQGKSRYCLMDKQDVLKDAVNEAMATNNGAKLGTNRIFFLDFVSNSAPVEKRKLQITDELFGIICDELQVPAYFIDTVIRDDQLGRLGFGSYLHPGEDRASGSFELSYRYTPRLQDGTLDLNGNLHYIYTRYNIRTHSSLTLCINPHIETRNLWVGLEGDDAVLKGIPANEWRDSDSAKFSVGHTRAERDLRSPLAFHILVTQMILEDWRTGLQADRQRLLDAELESGMVVNKPEGSPSSSDAKTELSPTPRPPDLEQGVPMQALDAGGPSNSDANCPDVNAPDTNENTTDPTGTRRKEVMTPKSRQERLRNLHDTTQRLTVAENSCKDIENRVTLLLRSVETLRSIPQRKEHGIDHPGRPSSSSMRNRILPSTLDREQQILESIRLSCQHSQQWTRCYKERTNIQIQLVTTEPHPIPHLPDPH